MDIKQECFDDEAINDKLLEDLWETETVDLNEDQNCNDIADIASLQENNDELKNSVNLDENVPNNNDCLDMPVLNLNNDDIVNNTKSSTNSPVSPKRKHNTCDLDSNNTPTKKSKTQKLNENNNNKSAINKSDNYKTKDNITKTNLSKTKCKDNNKQKIEKKTDIKSKVSCDVLKAPEKHSVKVCLERNAIIKSIEKLINQMKFNEHSEINNNNPMSNKAEIDRLEKLLKILKDRGSIGNTPTTFIVENQISNESYITGTKEDGIVNYQCEKPLPKIIIQPQRSKEVQLNNCNDVNLSGSLQLQNLQNVRQNLQNVQQNSNQSEQNSANQMENPNLILNSTFSVRQSSVDQNPILNLNVTNQNMSTSSTPTLMQSNNKMADQRQNAYEKPLTAQHVPAVNQLMQDTSTTVQEFPNLIPNVQNTNQKLPDQSTNFNPNISNVPNLAYHDQYLSKLLNESTSNFAQNTSNFSHSSSNSLNHNSANSSQNLTNSTQLIITIESTGAEAVAKLSTTTQNLPNLNQRLPDQIETVPKQTTVIASNFTHNPSSSGQNLPNFNNRNVNTPNTYPELSISVQSLQNLYQISPNQIGNVSKQTTVNTSNFNDNTSNFNHNPSNLNQNLPNSKNQIENAPKAVPKLNSVQKLQNLSNYRLSNQNLPKQAPVVENASNSIQTLSPYFNQRFPGHIENVAKQTTVIQKATNSIKSSKPVSNVTHLNKILPEQIKYVPKQTTKVQNTPNSVQTFSTPVQNYPHLSSHLLPDQTGNVKRKTVLAKGTFNVNSIHNELNSQNQLGHLIQNFNQTNQTCSSPISIPNSSNPVLKLPVLVTIPQNVKQTSSNVVNTAPKSTAQNVPTSTTYSSTQMTSSQYTHPYSNFNSFSFLPNSQPNFKQSTIQNSNNRNNLEKTRQYSSNPNILYNRPSQNYVRPSSNYAPRNLEQTILHKKTFPNISNVQRASNVSKASNVKRQSSIPTFSSIPTVSNIPTGSNNPTVVSRMSNIAERASPYSCYPLSTNNNTQNWNNPQQQPQCCNNTQSFDSIKHPIPSVLLNQYPATYNDFTDKMGVTILNIFNHRIVRCSLERLNEKYKIAKDMLTITTSLQIENICNKMINQLLQYFNVFYIKDFNEFRFIKHMKSYFLNNFDFHFDASFIKLFKKILYGGTSYCRFLSQKIDNYLNLLFTKEELDIFLKQCREHNKLIAITISMLGAPETNQQNTQNSGRKRSFEADRTLLETPVEESGRQTKKRISNGQITNLDETSQNLIPRTGNTLMLPKTKSNILTPSSSPTLSVVIDNDDDLLEVRPNPILVSDDDSVSLKSEKNDEIIEIFDETPKRMNLESTEKTYDESTFIIDENVNIPKEEEITTEDHVIKIFDEISKRLKYEIIEKNNDDENPLVIDENPPIIDENPLIIDENPLIIDENPLNIDQNVQVPKKKGVIDDDDDENCLIIDENPPMIDENPSIIDKIVDPKTDKIKTDLILKSTDSEVIKNYQNGDENTMVIDLIDDPKEEILDNVMQYEEGANEVEKLDLTQSNEKDQKRQIIDEFDEDENMLVIDEDVKNKEDEKDLILIKDDEVVLSQEILEAPPSDPHDVFEVQFVRDLMENEVKKNDNKTSSRYCSYCGNFAMQMCICETAKYCSEICQFGDWENHQSKCSAMMK